MPDPQAGPRVLAVHSLDRFTLSVPDLDEAARFYEAFGLDLERGKGRLLLRTAGSDHVWAELVRGEHKALRAVRFGVFERDFQVFAETLADVRIAAPEPGSNSIWCRAPDGLTLELAVAEKTSPDSKPPFGLPDTYHPARGTGPRSSVGKVRPRRLAHVALFTTDVEQAMGFYGARLGMKLSDRSRDDVAFMHGPHGSDHHLIALARSTGPGLHHCSWDVGKLSDVGQGAMQMEAAGYALGWGMGRHVLGSNYFHYVRDPWGSYSEYSADMDFVPAGAEWPAADHDPEDSFYQWGPPPPADFGVNYEIEPASPGASAEPTPNMRGL